MRSSSPCSDGGDPGSESDEDQQPHSLLVVPQTSSIEMSLWSLDASATSSMDTSLTADTEVCACVCVCGGGGGGGATSSMDTSLTADTEVCACVCVCVWGGGGGGGHQQYGHLLTADTEVCACGGGRQNGHLPVSLIISVL